MKQLSNNIFNTDSIEMLYRETSLCAEGEYEMRYQIKIIAQICKLHTS